MTDALTYYRQSGPITQAGRYARRLDHLPADIGELCKIVQGVSVHIFWAERYGLKLLEDRKVEVQSCTLPQ